MNIIYFCKTKPICIEALKILDSNFSEFEIIYIVCNDPPDELRCFAGLKSIEIISDDELYSLIDNDILTKKIDLGISFLYPKIIKKIVLELFQCINFHPAPLPEFRGIAGYSFAILENTNYWGVSAHIIDEDIDTGNILSVLKFKLDTSKETAKSLEALTSPYLIKLFILIMTKLKQRKKNENFLKGKAQHEGRYYSKKTLEQSRIIRDNDSFELIDRKIRAFWYPPYDGAYHEKLGPNFTLINKTILSKL